MTDFTVFFLILTRRRYFKLLGRNFEKLNHWPKPYFKKSHLIKLFSHYLYIGDWGDLARGALCTLDLREIIRSRAADQGSIPKG